MVEPASPIRREPVLGAVAPPGEEPLGRGYEMAAEIDPVVRRLQPIQCRDLDRRVAHHVEQLLVAPDIGFERRDVEIADQQSWYAQIFGPARHPLDEI